VDEPPNYRTFGETETSPFFHSEKSLAWWASVKGYSPSYKKAHLSRNAVPRPFLEYVFRAFVEATDDTERPDYSEYDKEMDAKRAKDANHQLSNYGI
jgi:hypothetical protein